MKRTLYYGVAALAFIPYVVLLLMGGIGLAIAGGLRKLRAWTHAELNDLEK